MHVEVDGVNESIEENQQHRSKKKLQRREVSEVGSSYVFTSLAKKDILKEGVLNGFLGHNVVIAEYTQN